jgi:ubiquinone/menaquinone biosynthesis C-methylase UbiE
VSPKVFETFAQIVAGHFGQRKPRAALEVGAGQQTLLALPNFAESRRVALNMLEFTNPCAALQACELVVGNSNEMPYFAEGEFDCVMSCSVLEHDKYFWRSIREIQRVLAPGGLFVVGVPVYRTLPTDCWNTTLTFRRHGLAYNADFYRFSEQTVREVMLESLELGRCVLVRRYPNPYYVASGIKVASSAKRAA